MSEALDGGNVYTCVLVRAGSRAHVCVRACVRALGRARLSVCVGLCERESLSVYACACVCL